MKVNVYAGRGNWFALTGKRVAALPSDRGPWELMSTVNMERVRSSHALEWSWRRS
jgi:hypothetical protein